MKKIVVLQWLVIAVWLGLIVFGLIAEAIALYEVFAGDVRLGAETLFWAGLYNAPFLSLIMVVVAVMRRNLILRHRESMPEAAAIYIIGFFGHVIGAAMIMSGGMDKVGARMISWWSVLFQYSGVLWAVFGPRLWYRLPWQKLWERPIRYC